MNRKGLSLVEFVSFLSKFPLDLRIVRAFYFGHYSVFKSCLSTFTLTYSAYTENYALLVFVLHFGI